MKVSIITINFNNASALEKTIKSVVDQQYDHIEYIIVDGGSTDNSVTIIESNNDYISNWISEKDTGIYNAMNKGIDLANGEYILFLNSGDTLTSQSAILDVVSNTSFGGDIIYGDYKFENGEKIYQDKLTPFYFLRTSLPHQSTFFKREVFEKLGGFDETYRISADRAFYVKCFLDGRFKFKHIKYPLTLFDQSGISNSDKYLEIKKIEDQRIFKEYYGLFYDDYLKYVNLQQELSMLRRKSFKGILKRLKKRLNK